MRLMTWALCEGGRWGFMVNTVKQPSALLARAIHLDAKMTYRGIYQLVVYCLRLECWSRGGALWRGLQTQSLGCGFVQRVTWKGRFMVKLCAKKLRETKCRKGK